MKKGVDKNKHVMYTLIIPCDTEQYDPWKRYRIKKNANDDFHESSLYKDSQFENEFWTWR